MRVLAEKVGAGYPEKKGGLRPPYIFITAIS